MTKSIAHRIPPLPAPRVPQAEKGGLNYADLVEDPAGVVTVVVGPWTAFFENDVVEILWGDKADVVATVPVADFLKDTVYVPVQTERLRAFGDGVFDMVARVIVRNNNDLYHSPPLKVRVKMSIPGGLDPDPATVSINEALSEPVVSDGRPDDLPLTVTIPPYLNMAASDELVVSWNGKAHTLPLIQDQDVGQATTWRVPAELADAAGDEVLIRYHISDIVANSSKWSPHSVYRPGPVRPPAPPAPWVEGTVDDAGQVVSLEDLDGCDLPVIAEQHGGRAGDVLTLHWEGMTTSGRSVRYQAPGSMVKRPTQSIRVDVPWRVVAPVAGNQSMTWYTIESKDGSLLRSMDRSLHVQGALPVLSAPQVPVAAGDRLDPENIGGSLAISIPPWQWMADDDRCQLQWVGTTSSGAVTTYHDEQAVNEDEPVTFSVPAGHVRQLDGGRLRLRYVILRHDAPQGRSADRGDWYRQLSPWLELNVKQEHRPLSIDGSPVTLEGRMVRVEAPVSHPPEGTWALRQANGGMPPYSYRTSTRAVEIDEATGRIVSFAEGTAVVTVTDARGHTASYTVQVRNTWHLFGLGIFTWHHKVASAAARYQGRIPTLDEFKLIRSAYGGKPPLDDQWAWTADSPSAGVHYAVRPVSGAVEARTSAGLFKASAAGWGTRLIPV